MTLRFSKMHGLGNDFMVIDGLTQRVDLAPEKIAELADRRTGIGFDQLLVVAPPDEPDADFYYRIFNADGTPAEQCGNGARCVALFVRKHQLASRETLVWQTTNGRIETRCLKDGVEVDMGPPSTAAERVPFDAPINANGLVEVQVCGQSLALQPVSMGNPHGVLFVESVADAAVEEVGAALTSHAIFPEGANIGFCEVVDRNFLRLRVFERGVGETRACGSGACAAMVAARMAGLVEERIKVSLPGGKVRIAWPGGDAPVKMEGPATLVYEGTLDIPGGRSDDKRRPRRRKPRKQRK